MTQPNLALNPPFLAETEPAQEPDFPVRITKRAKRKLFPFIISDENPWGSGVRFALSENGGQPHYFFADVDALDKRTHRFSKFGRVPIAVAEDEAQLFKGQVFDCRSFPPGPQTFYLKEGRDEPDAEPPEATIRLSIEKLERLQPDLFQEAGLFTKIATAVLNVTSMFGSGTAAPGWIGRLVGHDDPDGQAEAIEDIACKLWYYSPEPAVVLSINPFVVGAYSTPMDGVMLLRLPDWLVEDGPPGRTWSVGDRMISCNGYIALEDPSDDMPMGPRANGEWNDCWCILADPISEDHARLEQVKAEIPDEYWQRCRTMGQERLHAGHPRRDGRPWYSRIMIRDQKKPIWKPVLKYLR